MKVILSYIESSKTDEATGNLVSNGQKKRRKRKGEYWNMSTI